jgi:hypothetical protein
MVTRKVTRLKLVDLMVLTGAAAASFAVARAAQRDTNFSHFPGIYRWVDSTAICTCFWMWSVLGLRLARPRPPIWRLARQPGILACFISLLSFGLGGIQVGSFPYQANFNFDALCNRVVEMARGTSWSIMIAWSTLAVTRQWRAVPDWFDRAGRLLGTYMIVVFFIANVVLAYVIKFS